MTTPDAARLELTMLLNQAIATKLQLWTLLNEIENLYGTDIEGLDEWVSDETVDWDGFDAGLEESFRSFVLEDFDQ
jgi:hypothetical protein